MRQLDILCIGRQNFLDINNPNAPTAIYFPVSDRALAGIRQQVDIVSFGEQDIMPDCHAEEIAGLEVLGCSIHQPEYHA